MKIIEQRRTAKIYLQPGDSVAYIDLDPNPESELRYTNTLRVFVRIDGTVYGKGLQTPMDIPNFRSHLGDREITVQEILPSDDIDLGKLQWEVYKI